MASLRYRTVGSLTAVLMLCAQAIGGEVTAERLLHAESEPENWLMNLGGYEGHRFSGLSQIDRQNVDELVVRYNVTLGGMMDASGNYRAALPVSPLVEDGFMYIVDGWGAVSKLDLHNKGRELWRSEAGQHNLDAWLQASRGLAFYGTSVLSIAADGQLHWLDKESGEITRSVQVGDPRQGYSISAPPLVVGDVVVVGGGGADRGAKSQIDGINARTGAHLWRTHPAPEDGLGGAFQQTGIYNDQTGTTIWGASHSFPRYGAADGIAHFGNAAVALDVATGEIRWMEEFDSARQGEFSEAGSYQLIAREEGGAIVVHFGNDGLFHILDPQEEGRGLAVPYVPLWSQGTGNGAEEVTGLQAAWAEMPGCPNVLANPAFASAYSPVSGLSYGAGADWCVGPKRPIVTGITPDWLGAFYSGADNALGMLTAVDPVTGSVAAQHLFDFPLHAGALATAGGLVFTTTADGTLHALDDKTLEPVWSMKFASLAPVPPISFAVDGEQFIAIVVGGNAFADQISYRPPELGLSQNLFVVLVLGLPD